MNLHALRTPIAGIPRDLAPAPPEDEIVLFLRTHGVSSVRAMRLRLGQSGSALGARVLRLEAAGKVVRAGTERGSHGGSPAILWRAA
jgi:hypothetical protein